MEKWKNLWWKNEQKLRKLTNGVFCQVKICCLHTQLFISITDQVYGRRLILYRTGNIQSAILLSFVASTSQPPYGLQSTRPPMPCYIGLYVKYNVYVCDTGLPKPKPQTSKISKTGFIARAMPPSFITILWRRLKSLRKIERTWRPITIHLPRWERRGA